MKNTPFAALFRAKKTPEKRAENALFQARLTRINSCQFHETAPQNASSAIAQLLNYAFI